MTLAQGNDVRSVDDDGVLYIAGKGRSGTTLLATIFGMIDDHIFVGDLKTVWDEGVRQNFLCNCGAPFRDCEFWAAIINEAYGGMAACLGKNVHQLYERVIKQTEFRDIFEPSRRTPELQRDIDALNAETVTLHRAIRKVSGKSWIVDASKYPSCAWLLSELYGPRLKLVHLVRDPRGVAYSRTRTKIKPETGEASVTLNRTRPVIAARRWVRRHREIERLANRIQSTRITYEGFLGDTGATLAKIFDEAQVKQVLEGLHAAAVERPRIHTVAGNPDRFKKSGLVLKLDSEWKTRLSIIDRLLVQIASFPLMQAYGYRWNG